MKNRLSLSVLLLQIATTLHAANDANPSQSISVQEPHDEVARIDQLIKGTEESLVRLKSLKALLVQYKQAETIAVKNPNDTDNLLKLVNLAKQIQNSIAESYLQDYFAPQFLEELKKFSQIADKKHLPQAK